MTQVFRADGNVVPVTAVLAQPNIITQIKMLSKDGYSAVQVGFGASKKPKKPQAGHLKGIESVKTIREFAMTGDEVGELKRGDRLTVNLFKAGDKVQVSGVSKGRGFQGVVKRHGFHGSPATHGHKDQLRMPGSIGAGGVQRVFKDMRMPGRLGGNQVTVKGLEIIETDESKNILYIKGAVPGTRNSLLLISGPGKIELDQEVIPQEVVPKESAPIEEIKEPAVENNKTTEEETIKTE